MTHENGPVVTRAALSGLAAWLLLAGGAFAEPPPADESLAQFLGQRGWVAVQLHENVFNSRRTW